MTPKKRPPSENIITDKDFEFSDSNLDAFIASLDIDRLDEEDLDESFLEEAPLSVMQRLKRARTMRRMAPKLRRRKEVLRKRVASGDRLLLRARRAAVRLLRKRFAGKLGARYASLSPSQKISVDKIIEKKRPFVEKIAKRLLPRIRKAEMERVKSLRSGGHKESLDSDFEKFISENHEASNQIIFKKSEKSGIPVDVLDQVFQRGLEEWTPEIHESLDREQWAFARMNSFIAGGKAARTKDADLYEGILAQTRAAIARQKKIAARRHDSMLDAARRRDTAMRNRLTNEDFEKFMKELHPNCGTPECCGECGVSEEGGAGECGTKKLRDRYSKDTPGSRIRSK